MRRIVLALSLATAMLAAALPSVAWASATDGCLTCSPWPPSDPAPPSDVTPPTVTGTNPADGAMRADRDKNITAKFTEAINQAALDGSTFTLVTEGSTTPVEAVVSYDASTKTVKLNPSGRLAKKTSYKALIEGGGDADGLAIKDLSGNELAADYVWSFTTGRR